MSESKWWSSLWFLEKKKTKKKKPVTETNYSGLSMLNGTTV